MLHNGMFAATYCWTFFYFLTSPKDYTRSSREPSKILTSIPKSAKDCTEMEIRESCEDDWNQIESLYRAAFPDEDLVPVVHELLHLPNKDSSGGMVTSLVAISSSNSLVIGNVILTLCGGTDQKEGLLAPLAVLPRHQKQGVGSQLVQTVFRTLEEKGIPKVYVLGDPAYYGRFGFSTEQTVAPPYPLDPEYATAWQSKHLGVVGSENVEKKQDTNESPRRLWIPEVWRKPELWGP